MCVLVMGGYAIVDVSNVLFDCVLQFAIAIGN